MSTPNRIMILGAGPNQLPVIRQALAQGLHVITVDYLPDNVGHTISSQYVNCSTADKEGVLAAARELKIDGILTFASDVAAPTVAFAAAALGLPGPTPGAVAAMVDKGRFRQSQHENGLNSCGFVTGQSLDHAVQQAGALARPLIFKPVDSSGSRGITQVDSFDLQAMSKAFEHAQTNSRSGTVCIEEMAGGTDISGDIFLYGGKMRCGSITHKHTREFIPTGHSLPPVLAATDQQRVIREVEQNCAALGYADGILDFDARVAPDKVTVLEAGPRGGGNGVPMVIERGTGINLMKMAIDYALHGTVKIPAGRENTRPCGSWIFGISQAGRLAHIAAQNKLVAAVPEVFWYHVNYAVDEDVPAFTHSASSLGCALFDIPDGTTYDDMLERLQPALQIEVV